MIDEDTAKRTLLQTVVKWLILGVFILGIRFLRWGGILGLVGIGTFAGDIWLAFRLADPDTGELTGTEGTAVLALLIAGVVLYVVASGADAGGCGRTRCRPRHDPRHASAECSCECTTGPRGGLFGSRAVASASPC